jgi:hypothetical protein
MELHPDDRPKTAEDLRQFLIGTRDLPARTQTQIRPKETIFDFVGEKPERLLIWVSGGLLFITLVASLIH